MTELLRKIEETDIPEIKATLSEVFGDEEFANIERLGGMTNRSYKVTRNDSKEYLVRLPGEGTEELIKRSDEKKSTDLACKLGIDTKLLFFADDGRKVMEFIRNPQPMSEEVLKQPEIIRQAAIIFKKLHTCGENTGVRFEVFEMADEYEKLINQYKVALYDDYKTIRDNVMQIKAEVDDGVEEPRVPCHNDCLAANWVLGEDNKLYLIDWEYSGMNEAMWDLSCLSIEVGYSSDEDERLLFEYYGRPITVVEKKKFVAAKTYVDFLWTLWGLTRVPYDGKFMQEYADGRYDRLKKNIEIYKSL